jgi:hypothetical protein
MDTTLTLAFALRAVAMTLFLSGALLLFRAWRSSSLQSVLAYSVLRRERRRAIVSSLLVLFCFVGLAVGLSAYQDLQGVFSELAQVVGGGLLLLASMATLALAWLGFGTLPAPEEGRMIADAPEGYVAAVGVADRASSP